MIKKNIFLITIVLLALFLRIYRISDNPPSLNWDEVSHGYNAFSILKTGGDEWGAKLPLIFRAYGDYKLPLYIYLTIPWIIAFGLNALSVRLTSVLSGVGIVFVSYLISQKILRDKKVSLLVAFMVAVSPWGLFLSRVAVEANLAAFLFCLGMYFLFSWLKEQKGKKLIFLSISWGLSLYSYNSARILVPIFLGFLIVLFLKRRKVLSLFLPLILLLLFSAPMSYQFFNQSAKARYNLVSLIDQGTINAINEKRNNSQLPQLIKRAFYNRYVFFVSSSLKNYLANLSPEYLFIKGGDNYQFSSPQNPLLYLITSPFLILGLVWILIKGTLEERILLLWFFSGIIPSAVTKDAPHVLRSILVLPSPIILAGIGYQKLSDKLKKGSLFKGNLVLGILILAIIFSFYKWWLNYWQYYRPLYSWAWQDGYQRMVEKMSAYYAENEEIFVTKRYGEPHEFILFYTKYNPAKYQNDETKKWDFHADWYWIDGFDKYRFYNDWEASMVKCNKKRCLLIASPGNYPPGWTKINEVLSIQGNLVFEFLKNQ